MFAGRQKMKGPLRPKDIHGHCPWAIRKDSAALRNSWAGEVGMGEAIVFWFWFCFFVGGCCFEMLEFLTCVRQILCH
jgi:hypothetical protein